MTRMYKKKPLHWWFISQTGNLTSGSAKQWDHKTNVEGCYIQYTWHTNHGRERDRDTERVQGGVLLHIKYIIRIMKEKEKN